MDHTEQIKRLKENIGSVLVGKEKQTRWLLTALLARGHVLLEDVPGTGKTMLAKTLAQSVEAKYHRVQFTPDLLPSDLLGLNYYNQKEGIFTFKEGPVFSNILLADEINRATPRTQSSLLECMEEQQVTVDGKTYMLEAPFFVIATQNPIETVGTFPLPEAQLDRFLMKFSLGNTKAEEEMEVIKRFLYGNPFQKLEPVCETEEILVLQKEVQEVFLHEELMEYIVKIVMATRVHKQIYTGVSTRGTLALVRAAKALAYVNGRRFVTPEEIKELAVPVLAHRISLQKGEGRRRPETVMEELIEGIPVPTEDWSH